MSRKFLRELVQGAVFVWEPAVARPNKAGVRVRLRAYGCAESLGLVQQAGGSVGYVYNLETLRYRQAASWDGRPETLFSALEKLREFRIDVFSLAGEAITDDLYADINRFCRSRRDAAVEVDRALFYETGFDIFVTVEIEPGSMIAVIPMEEVPGLRRAEAEDARSAVLDLSLPVI